MDRGALWTIVHGVVELGMTQQLSTAQYSFPGGSNGKESACSVRDLGLIPGLEGPLKEGMATLSSILAWRIPWPEEPGGLQSIGLQSQTGLSNKHFHFHLAIS